MRRIVLRIVVSRLALASGVAGGMIVAVMACGVLELCLGDDDGSCSWQTASWSELWPVFARAGLGSSIATMFLTAVLVAAIVRTSTAHDLAARTLRGALVASAVLIPLWLVCAACVGAAIGGSDLWLASMICPSLLLFAPLGVAFGLVFIALLGPVVSRLERPTTEAVLAARLSGVLALAIATSLVGALALLNRLPLAFVFVPLVGAGAPCVLDAIALVVSEWRARRWIARVRRGELTPWQVVELSDAHVPDDLVPLDRKKGRWLALVHAGASTAYRDLPSAIALVLDDQRIQLA